MNIYQATKGHGMNLLWQNLFVWFLCIRNFWVLSFAFAPNTPTITAKPAANNTHIHRKQPQKQCPSMNIKTGRTSHGTLKS
jgi:hypothetical protein